MINLKLKPLIVANYQAATQCPYLPQYIKSLTHIPTNMQTHVHVHTEIHECKSKELRKWYFGNLSERPEDGQQGFGE